MEEPSYRNLFVAESRENHETIVKNLLILEEDQDDEAIDEIFRSAHTLKGMSASMGFNEMEHLCHAMEDVFQSIREGDQRISEGLTDILLSAADKIEEMLDDIEAGGDTSAIHCGELVERLKILPPKQNPDQLGEQGRNRYRMRIEVVESCPMKDVRAMLVMQNLEELGTILSCTPSREQIDSGNFTGAFELEILSDAGREALEGASMGTDISGVIIEPVSDPVSGVDTENKPEEPVRPSEKIEKNREVKNIRVDITRLDQMMNLVEDLVINGGRLKQIARKYQIKELDDSLNMVGRSISDLQNIMMNIRMIPLNHIFNRFPRVVRDVAHHDGKEVTFIIEGGETELDRSVMDGLSDPLLHLIRNAVNHGIERPDDRKKAGKPENGSILLSARREKGNVIIELSDDGAGIDRSRVLSKAVERGLISSEQSVQLADEEIIGFLFQPGFSTAETVTDISGRGVGLDVVRSTIESLCGTISIETKPGKGTRFTLILPPTMAIIEVMMVRTNGRRYAIPINAVVEVARVDQEGIHRIGGSEALLLRDEVLQLYRLEEMFSPLSGVETVVVVQYRGRKCCIPVDIVEGQQEVVVKPVAGIIGTCRGIGGLTIPGDGDVVPVLDINTMV